MQKTTPILYVAILLLAGATAVLFMQNRRGTENLRAAQAEEQTTRSRYGQALDDIATIQDSLNAITLTDSSGTLRPSSLTAEQRLSPNRGDEALARVAELRAGIQRARVRIQALEARVKSSGAHIAGLERMVARLKTGLADKEAMVAALSSRVDSLQTHVDGLTATVAQNQTVIATQDSTLEERRRELGTIYYTIGKRTDLLKSGVVVARGGLLGMGKTLDPSGTVNEASFQSIDTDQQTVIPIPAAKARVLTPQPPTSYTLEPVEGHLQLRIIDAHEFRKVRHVVIVTA